MLKSAQSAQYRTLCFRHSGILEAWVYVGLRIQDGGAVPLHDPGEILFTDGMGLEIFF